MQLLDKKYVRQGQLQYYPRGYVTPLKENILFLYNAFEPKHITLVFVFVMLLKVYLT